MLTPEVQNAIPDGLIAFTIITEVCTFGDVIDQVYGRTVLHWDNGTRSLWNGILHRNEESSNNDVRHSLPIQSDYCCWLVGHSGKKGGKAAQFSDPSDISIWNNLLFVCHSSNYCVRIIDIDNFVEKKKGGLFDRTPFPKLLDPPLRICCRYYQRNI